MTHVSPTRVNRWSQEPHVLMPAFLKTVHLYRWQFHHETSRSLRFNSQSEILFFLFAWPLHWWRAYGIRGGMTPGTWLAGEHAWRYLNYVTYFFASAALPHRPCHRPSLVLSLCLCFFLNHCWLVTICHNPAQFSQFSPSQVTPDPKPTPVAFRGAWLWCRGTCMRCLVAHRTCGFHQIRGYRRSPPSLTVSYWMCSGQAKRKSLIFSICIVIVCTSCPTRWGPGKRAIHPVDCRAGDSDTSGFVLSDSIPWIP